MRSCNRVNCVSNIKEYQPTLRRMQTNIQSKKNFRSLLIFVNCLKLRTYIHRVLSGEELAETLPVSRERLHCISTVPALYPIIMQGLWGKRNFLDRESKATLGVNWG